MSNSSRPDPPPLKVENCIALFVGFTTINGLLYYWSLNKPYDQFSLKKNGFSPLLPELKSTSEGLSTKKPTTSAPEWLSSSLTPSLKTQTSESSSLLNKNSLSQNSPNPQAPKKLDSTPKNSAVSSPTPPSPTPTPVVEFSDVPNHSWASRSITSLHQQKIVAGLPNHEFEPNKFATRGEFAVLLQKVFGKENKPNGIKFKDVSSSYWASDAIKNVSKMGILKGYPAQDFRPDQPITRAEVLVALATALKLKTPEKPTKTLEVFQDADQVLKYAIAKVAAAKEAGLVAGYPKDKILVPNKPATRAEMATMVYQALATSQEFKQASN